MNLTKPKKIKLTKQTSLALNLICEMSKHYHQTTIAKQHNIACFQFYKKLADLTPKHIWAFLTEEENTEINIQKAFDLHQSITNEIPEKFGLIFKYKEAQVIPLSEPNPLKYFLIAITLTKKNDYFILRTHKYITHKGWLPDPHHFSIPLDALTLRHHSTPFEINIDFDFDLEVNLAEQNFESEIAAMDDNLEKLINFWLNASRKQNTAATIHEKVNIINGQKPSLLTFIQVTNSV